MLSRLWIVLITVFALPAAADTPLRVMASFSILGDVVENIAGDRATVEVLVGPGSDPHVYRPTPQDARRMRDADLLVVNGLGFEGWLDRLVVASGYDGPIAVVGDELTHTKDEVEHLEDHGGHHEDHRGHAEHDDHADHDGHDGHEDHDEHGEPADHESHGHHDTHADHEGHDDHADHDNHTAHSHAHHHTHGPDPHAWQDPRNVMVYAHAIADALEAADPAGAPQYAANLARYTARLVALHDDLTNRFAALPETRRRVVTSHDAFGYFGRAYGVTFLAAQGLSTEAQSSARMVASLITQIRQDAIPAIFVETISDKRLLEQIARETGAVIGGALYSDALSGPDGPAPTYITMMRHNSTQLLEALAR